MELLPLKKEVYAGKRFTVRYSTNGYYDICPSAHGFRITYTPFETPLEKSFDDVFFGEWLEQPIAFGAFENGRLIGYVGKLEPPFSHQQSLCVRSGKTQHRDRNTADAYHNGGGKLL